MQNEYKYKTNLDPLVESGFQNLTPSKNDRSVFQQLKPSKTKLTHTLVKYDGDVGFDFFGFNIRQYKVGIHQSNTDRLL